MADAIVSQNDESQPKSKKIRINLDPIEAPRIDCILPDGTIVELPPTYADPSVLFARQVRISMTSNLFNFSELANFDFFSDDKNRSRKSKET